MVGILAFPGHPPCLTKGMIGVGDRNSCGHVLLHSKITFHDLAIWEKQL